MEELTAQLSEGITADPPLPEEDILSGALQKKQEWALPDTEVVKASVSAMQGRVR